MRMREYLQRLASSDQQIRRQQLLAILTEIGCTFTHHHDQVAGYRPENIAVRFHTQWPRLVIGAHYDSICGSTGANDNAAAVCVLLALLHSYSDRPPAIPLDVVFFDLEEHGSCGSQAYIARLSASTTSLTREILAMVNLDICGVGNTILCGPAKHACTGPLAQPLQETQRSYPMPCHILPLLPASDDRPFEKAGIPNISVCIVPAIDVDSMIDSMHALSQGKRPQTRPSILETFHNGRYDSLTTVENKAMEHLLHWITDFVQHFNAHYLQDRARSTTHLCNITSGEIEQ